MDRDLLGESGIIMNFNDHTVTWNTDIIPMKDRATISSVEAYMSANETKRAQRWIFLSSKTLDADHKPASLDDVIKTCENLHVEEHHKLKILLQKYELLFDGTRGELNMDLIPISLQLMDPNCKPVHARAYTVPKSVEQQLQ
jgi:hypothetical protein